MPVQRIEVLLEGDWTIIKRVLEGLDNLQKRFGNKLKMPTQIAERVHQKLKPRHRGRMRKWKLIIQGKHGKTREILLDHEYETEEEAEREAEDIADVEYTDNDIAWAVAPA